MDPMLSTTMTLRHPLLALVPEASPREQIQALGRLGVAITDLIDVARSLFSTEGEAILALPRPLPELLAVLPAEATEKALLGFTVKSVLEASAVRENESLVSWRTYPTTLRDLFDEKNPAILQIIYVGTLLTYPRASTAWAHNAKVMRALKHPAALCAVSVPRVKFFDRIYETSPQTTCEHPFLYFSKEGC